MSSALTESTSTPWGDEATSSVGGGGASSKALAPLPEATEEIELISSTATTETALKTQTVYRYTDKGEVEKVVRKFRTVTMRTRVPAAVRARRNNLAKFGAAKNLVENETLTKTSAEDIFLELPSAGVEREEQKTREAFSGGVRGLGWGEEGAGGGGGRWPQPLPIRNTLPLSLGTRAHALPACSHSHSHSPPPLHPTLPSPQQSVSSCRICSGSHWTMMCPYKEHVKNGGTVPGMAPGAAAAAAGGGGPQGMATSAPMGVYKAPSLRAGADGAPRPIVEADMLQLKVSNLSPETTEDDLRGLFQSFGMLDHKFRIARDNHGESKCFAYLKYATHREAEAARAALNGWRLNYMVIKVEFVAPRDPSRSGPGGGGGGHRHLSGYGKALADTSGSNILSTKH